MGYDLNRFVKEVDEEFICPICTMVLENGVQSQHCEHTYCDACIREWLTVNNICPVDRKQLKLEEIKPIPRILNNLLNKFEIKCDFEPSGCQAVLKLENIENHCKSCEFDPNFKINCDKECGLEMTKTEFKSHSCVNKLSTIVMALQKQMSDYENEMKDLRRKHSWFSPNGLNVIVNYIECVKTDFGIYDNGVAQCAHLLNKNYPYFEVKVIELGTDRIYLGLCCNFLTQSNSILKYFAYDGSAGLAYTYLSGNEDTVPKWEMGDVIGCGIKFSKPANLSTNTFPVYFTRNKKTIWEKSINIDMFGLYPTLFIGSIGTKVIAL